MAKVFRFHDGSNNIEDWQISNAYGGVAINAISDPSGASTNRQITSIPSPFARVDLIQNAFKTLAGNRNLDGYTIYHKMVSDCFDLGEIFYNLDRLKDKIKIIVWDSTQDLHVLLNSDNPKHRLLGETLRLYLEQDKKAYNFDLLQRIYLLNYIGGPNPVNIIGGTSPSTLFFTSANNLNYVNIQFGAAKAFTDNDQLPDHGFKPFYQRDFEFQKYIYCLKAFIPSFSRKFKELNDYLDLSFVKLTQQQKLEINGLTKEYFESQYSPLTIKHDGETVEILGFRLRKKVNNPALIEQTSDFVINSPKISPGPKPLVLPNSTGNEYGQLRYTTDKWESNNKAPYADPDDISVRTLPFVGDTYPYLTVSDFLEPYLIRTVFPINKDKFFDGNLKSSLNGESKGYLLPLKKKYFDYFNISDLQGLTSDGKLIYETEKRGSEGVKVTLRIPIKNNKYIAFERIYYPSANDSQIPEPELNRNRGTIIENQFGLSLYPFLKLRETSANFYRVCLMDRDLLPLTSANSYKLNFFDGAANQPVAVKAVKRRSEKENDGVSSDFYVLDHGFDYIELKHNLATGLIVPLFEKLPQGSEKFTFAVDFGTTNTHIEYRIGDGDPKPFEINDDDIQIATLHDPLFVLQDASLNGTGATILIDQILHEFMPGKIGKQSEFSMPMRTAIGSHRNLELSTPTFALADFNVSFFYEKYNRTKNSKIRTNLKWSNYVQDSREMKGVEAYFENLILLIRNKIILNGGELASTRLIWFYPSSMMIYRRNMLESKWNELFEKYISKRTVPLKLSESIAPFYYYKNRLGVAASDKPVVSMDIGGGTTDIVIYTNNKPQILTSFRFAANGIFGDAFNGSPQINGFVLKYLGKIQQLLTDNKQYELLKVLEDIRNSGKSEDIIAFFFSIQNNKKIKEQNIPISFHKELSLDTDFKIVFVLFYSALIYHLAKLMKAKGLASPRYITFSGTGSKVINIADSSPKLSALSELTKRIFARILEPNTGTIELKQFEEAKEITCKGGLMMDDSLDVTIDTIKSVLLGNDSGVLIPETSVTYNQLTPDYEEGVIRGFTEFLNELFDLNKEFNFSNNFGINPVQLDRYKEILLEDAMEFLKSGIEVKKKDLQGNNDIDIEETLFFYPLIGGLNRLAFKINSGL